MSLPLDAAWEVSQFLQTQGVRHVVIGGLAVLKWGRVRLTSDADLTVSVPVEDSAELVRLLTERFGSRVSDPAAMAARTRMVLIRATNGVEVDVSLALPGYEDEVMRRARSLALDDERALPVCSPEDLIIHKAVAGRPQDILDVRGIVQRQRGKLDLPYIRLWLGQFSEILENEDILARFERALSGPV